MSNVTNIFSGKLQTVADLENGANKIENGLETVNKNFIKKMVSTLNTIMSIAQRKENGIFNLILKWFRLYLKLGVIINPDDKKLLKCYEKSAPTVITYIIGCLQYKTKEVPNYHYNLLEILEELMETIQPSILQEITRFEKGTIGCLWSPIDMAGDFNTQMKALKLLSVLLKQFDENRQNEELKCIKWTNLNFFQEKLKTIVQATKLSHFLENYSRELLNNYNMNFSKDITVYSFYCKSAIMGNKYKFHKPLNLQKFWIDINCCPKSVSYTGRFKLNSSTKYENIGVILKIQNMILKNNTLQVYFNKPGDFSKHSDYLSNIADNVIEFTLTMEEKERLINNGYVIEYFNRLAESKSTIYEKTDGKNKNIFDLLKNEMTKTLQENKNKNASIGSNISKKNKNFRTTSTSEKNIDHEKTPEFFVNPQCKTGAEVLLQSPKISVNLESDVKKLPSRNVRNRTKFFTSLLMEDLDEGVYGTKKPKRKRLQKAKSRQTMSRFKQVCKVTPHIDLTKTEKIESIEQNEMSTNENIVKIPLNNNVSKKSLQLINTQVCDEVLKQVADIFDPINTTYEKPCQSYSLIQKTCKDITKSKGRKKKINPENESSVEKKRKLTNCYLPDNKENINPRNVIVVDNIRPLSRTKSTLSPHLFETQVSDELACSNKIPKTKKSKKIGENMVIDLTLDANEQLPICLEYNEDKEDNNNENISSSDSIEYEEVRGLNENYVTDIDHIATPTKTILSNSSKVTTPRPISSMNLSNLAESDMDITQVFNCQGQLDQQSKIDNKNTLQDDNLDMELTKSCYNHENTKNFEPDRDFFHVNDEVPICIQEILNDFDCSSDNEFDSSYKTPSKKTSYDVMPKHLSGNDLTECKYNRHCRDIEDYSISNEDSSYGEFVDVPDLLMCDKSRNQNLAIMQNTPLFLTKNVCQENDLCTFADKKRKICKSNTASVATSCQVTPTAIIFHHLQVSEKKSVILRTENSKKMSKASKRLNDYFTGKNINVALQGQHLDNFEKANCTLLPHSTCHAKQNFNRTHTLEVHNISENNVISKSSNPCRYGTNMKNPLDKILYTVNVGSLSQPQSTSTDSNLAEEIENNRCGIQQNIPSAESKSSFKKDLLHIIEDYKININLRLDNALRLVVKNISDKYTRKFLDITKTVLKKSDANRIELEQIRLNIGRLIRELESQYDAFINKSKEFDIHREVTERVMENVMNIDVSNCIAKDYKDITNQLDIEQNGVFLKVWRKYLDNQK